RHLRNYLFAGAQLEYWHRWIDMHLAGAVIGCWRAVKQCIASAPIWNEFFVHRIRIHILSFDISNVFDPLLSGTFPPIHLRSINSTTELTHCGEPTKYDSRSMILMILNVVNSNPDGYEDCSDNRATSDDFVGIEHLTEPVFLWKRVCGGIVLCLGFFALYFSLLLFASHKITPATLASLVFADLIGLAFVWWSC